MKKIFIILFLICFNIFNFAFCEDENKYTNMDWWNSFNDKYLSENLEKLYKNNYDLKNAALKIKENEQMVKMQFAQELPFLSLTGE